MAILIGSSTTTGYTDTGSNSDYNFVGGANLRIYWRTYSCVASGNVTSLYLYSRGWTVNNCKMLLADSSGTVLAATASIDTGTDGWTSASIASTAVTSGQNYRLGVVNDCSDNVYIGLYGNTGITDIDYDNTGNTYASDPPASAIGSDGQATYNGFLMYADGGATMLRLTAHESAAGVTDVAGVVFEAPTSGLTGARLGEFTGATFEASLDGGLAVLKVPVADFGGTSLTVSDTPVAALQHPVLGTGLVSCTVVTE